MSGLSKRTFEPNARNESKHFHKRSRMRGTMEGPHAGARMDNIDQTTELQPTSDSATGPLSRTLPTRGFPPSQRSATAENPIRRLPPPPPPQRARTRFTGNDSHARTGPLHGHPHRSVGIPRQNSRYPRNLSDTGRGAEANWATHSESVKEELSCFMDDATDIPVAPHLNSVSSSCSRLWEELCTTIHLRDSMAAQVKNEIESSLTHLEAQREIITRERTQLEKMRGELEVMRSGIAKTREVAQEEANRVKLEKEALYVISTEVSVQVAELKGLKRQLEEEWSKMDGSKLKIEAHKSVENRPLNESIDQDRCTAMRASFGQQKLTADNPDCIVSEKPNSLDLSSSLNKLGDSETQRESFRCAKAYKRKIEEGASSASMTNSVPSAVTRVQGSSSIVDSDTLKQSEATISPASIETTAEASIPKQSEGEDTPASILNSTVKEESLSTGTEYPENLCVFSDVKLQSESFPCAKAYKQKKEERARGASSASMINSVPNSTATEESLYAGMECLGNLCVFSNVEPLTESFPCAKACKQNEEGARGASSASMINSTPSPVTRVQGSSSIVDSDKLKQSEVENTPVSIETIADASILEQSEGENTPASILNSTTTEESLSACMECPGNSCVFSDVKSPTEPFPCAMACKQKKEEGASSASTINSALSAVTRVQGSSSIVDSNRLKQSEAENTPVSIETTADASILEQSEGENTPASNLNSTATEESLSSSMEYPGNMCVSSDAKPQSESFPCAKAYKRKKEEGASSASVINSVQSTVTGVTESSSIVDSNRLKQSEAENTPMSIETTADASILKQSEVENTPARILNSTMTEESLSSGTEYPGNLCASSDAKSQSESFPYAEAYTRKKEERARGASSASMINSAPSTVTGVTQSSSIVDSDTLKQSEAENTPVNIETIADASILKQSEGENSPASILNSTATEESISSGMEYPRNLCASSDAKSQSESFSCAKAYTRKKEEGSRGASSASMINSVLSTVTGVTGSLSIVDSDTLKQSEAENTPASIENTADVSILKQSKGETTLASILNSTASEESLSSGTEYPGILCVSSDVKPQRESFPFAKAYTRKKEEGARGASSARMINSVLSTVTGITGSSSIVDSDRLKQSEAENTPVSIENTADARILKQSKGENTPASILNSTVTEESLSSGMEFPGILCVSSDIKPERKYFPCAKAYKRKIKEGARGASSASMINSVLSTVTGITGSSSMVDSDTLKQREAENTPVSIETTADASILKQSKEENTPASILNSIMTEQSLSAGTEYPGNLCVFSDVKNDKLDEMVVSQHLEIMRKDPLLDGYVLEHDNIVESDTGLIVSSSQKEGLLHSKRDRIPIEVALREDAPGLYEMLNEKRLLDEGDVYGDFSEEFCLDTELHLERSKDLDRNMEKIWQLPPFCAVTPRGELPPLNRENLAFGNDKTSYCISCLESLIEHANLMKQRDWFVAWGWCRELRSFIFIFDDHNRIVLERPENGYATYFFAKLEKVPIKWQVIRLIRVMIIANDPQTTLIEDRPLEVEKDLIEKEGNFFEEYGWSPNAGLGSLLHLCDHIIHNMEEDSIISYWKQKIEKCLMDGYDDGRRTLQHVELHGDGFENDEVIRARDEDELNASESI